MKKDLINIKNFSVYYEKLKAINNINTTIKEHEITAIIGPSGCGKSSLLRCLNRMNDFIEGFSFEGSIIYKSIDINSKQLDPIELRRNIGMVFQKPNPFPKSIYNNLVWGPKVNFYKNDLNELVESSLRSAALWDEVKDRLDKPANTLSGGQQQRLCIARALAMKPKVLLMDEPCSALDPIATEKIEELILELKKNYTLIIVTHNMQQASRISDKTLFLYNGDLIESGDTKAIFNMPKHKRTRDYVSGLIG